MRNMYSVPVILGAMFAGFALNRLTGLAKAGSVTLCYCGLEICFICIVLAVSDIFGFTLPWMVRPGETVGAADIPGACLHAVFEIAFMYFLLVPVLRKYVPDLTGLSAKTAGKP